MKILLHCVYYPPEVGGLESHVSGLAEGLVRRGLEVRVVTSRSLPGLPREEEIKGVRVKRTWLPSRSAVGLGGPRSRFHTGNPKLGPMGGSHPCPVIRFSSPRRVGGESGR